MDKTTSAGYQAAEAAITPSYKNEDGKMASGANKTMMPVPGRSFCWKK